MLLLLRSGVRLDSSTTLHEADCGIAFILPCLLQEV